MLFVRLVNSVLCEIWLYVGWTEANEAYSECLRTAQGIEGAMECYAQLTAVIGELSLEFVSCLF